MRKSIILFCLTLLVLPISAYEFNELFSSTTICSDSSNHNLKLLRVYDSFDESEQFLFTDRVYDIQYSDIDNLHLVLGYDFSQPQNPAILIVYVNSSDWYFLTGEIAVKFPTSTIRVSGKASSKMDSGSSLQTSISITSGLSDFSKAIDHFSSNDTPVRIYTKEKGYIDFMVPAAFFQRAFQLTKDEVEKQKAEAGIK